MEIYYYIIVKFPLFFITFATQRVTIHKTHHPLLTLLQYERWHIALSSTVAIAKFA